MFDWLMNFWIFRPLMMGLFGIGMGSTPQESQMYGLTGEIGRFGTSQGENDILQSQNFWSAIMSGDPQKIATVLGPQMSTINRQAQQQKKTAAEFGTRSGGTTAAMNALDTSTLSSIRGMIANLTGSAASNLGSMGENLFSTGLSGATSAFGEAQTMQQQQAAKMNDIFKSAVDVGLAPFTRGTSLMGLAGGKFDISNLTNPFSNSTAINAGGPTYMPGGGPSVTPPDPWSMPPGSVAPPPDLWS